MPDIFADILNRKTDEVSRPKALPVGSYTCMVNGPYRPGKVGQNQTDVVDFQLKVISVGPDVSPEEVAGFPDGVIGKEVRARFFLTEDAVYRLSDFLENLGIEKGLSFKEALANAPGKTVVVNLTQQPSQDGTQMFSNIRSYAKV